LWRAAYGGEASACQGARMPVLFGQHSETNAKGRPRYQIIPTVKSRCAFSTSMSDEEAVKAGTGRVVQAE
jgi:hypothetical protein